MAESDNRPRACKLCGDDLLKGSKHLPTGQEVCGHCYSVLKEYFLKKKEGDG